MPTTEKHTRIEKIAKLLSRAREESGVDDEEVLGKAFDKLLDEEEELLDLILKIIK